MTTNESRIEQGIRQKLIMLDAESKSITYLKQNKTIRYTDPEEKVRAETYLSFVFDYNYKPERIAVEVQMPARTPNFYADIVVYDDDDRKKPYIVVECKKQDISEAEFVQAIEQGFGNAVSLRAHYLWVTTLVKSKYYNVEEFPSGERVANLLATIPRFGQSKLAKAKYYKGRIDENGNPSFDLEKVTESDLTRIFGLAHQALWGGGKRNPSEAFDELDKLIFCKLWDERQLRKRGEPYDFQEFSGESPEFLRHRILALYGKGREKDPEVFRDDIRLTANELKTIVGYVAGVNFSETDLDSKGRAFETFLGSFFRGDFGQYFTPRAVVKFITDALPITNESYVLDTSCGSGGFLLYALDKIRASADELAALGYFEKGSVQHHKYWHDFASTRLFGIEINDSIARTAKMNMIIHDDGHTNVVASDGLLDANEIAKRSGNVHFRNDAFDFIITNPPFGSIVKQTEQAYLRNYNFGIKDINWIERKRSGVSIYSQRDSQSTEVLFLEQCHRFLREGGFLAMVIPDGVLTNSSLQYVRDGIAEYYRIVAVVSLPQLTFAATGAGVKSSVIFLRKLSVAETNAAKNTKTKLQDKLWERTKHRTNIERLESEKAATIKQHTGFNPETIDWSNEGNAKLIEKDEAELLNSYSRKTIEKTAEFKEWKSAVSAEFSDKIATEKELLEELYQTELADETPDYPIFMAIAENIGYDATGKTIPQNDLPDITQELKRFIKDITQSREHFFL